MSDYQNIDELMTGVEPRSPRRTHGVGDPAEGALGTFSDQRDSEGEPWQYAPQQVAKQAAPQRPRGLAVMLGDALADTLRSLAGRWRRARGVKSLTGLLKKTIAVGFRKVWRNWRF